MDANAKKILEYLESHGQGIMTDIGNPLLEIFGRPVDEKSTMKHKGHEVSVFLDVLIEADWIKLSGRPDHDLGKQTGSGSFIWLGFQPISAAIRPKGLEQLALDRAANTENKMEKSVLTTNASIQSLNGLTEKFIGFQKTWIKVAAIAACVAAVATGWSLVRDMSISGETHTIKLIPTDSILQKQEKELRSLEKTVSDLRDNLKNLKSGVPIVDTPKTPLKPNPVDKP